VHCRSPSARCPRSGPGGFIRAGLNDLGAGHLSYLKIDTLRCLFHIFAF
jgi:hypothetical protein